MAHVKRSIYHHVFIEYLHATSGAGRSPQNTGTDGIGNPADIA
jgi:hypothetical protein